MGCDTSAACNQGIQRRFQSTHPHGVRRYYLNNSEVKEQVSIHAPTWGATDDKYIIPKKEKVSIHAPTWGATRCRVYPKVAQRFQSTHPHGVRLNSTIDGTAALQFQSTHPHGVRLPMTHLSIFQRRFNPRTHMGCDIIKHLFSLIRIVSIHAPTWGATSIWTYSSR